MKPEKAIKVLLSDRATYKEWEEAVTIAVESLKGMSAEEYRQRLMEVFHKTDHDELITYVVMPKEEEFKSLEYILRQYKYEPRPHGEWERTDNRWGVGTWRCTHCNSYYDIDTNYCPTCGASMRKEGKNEEE